MVEEFKRKMIIEFEMTDSGLIRYFLRIQVRQGDIIFFLSQEKRVRICLKRFIWKKANQTLVQWG